MYCNGVCTRTNLWVLRYVPQVVVMMGSSNERTTAGSLGGLGSSSLATTPVFIVMRYVELRWSWWWWTRELASNNGEEGGVDGDGQTGSGQIVGRVTVFFVCNTSVSGILCLNREVAVPPVFGHHNVAVCVAPDCYFPFCFCCSSATIVSQL